MAKPKFDYDSEDFYEEIMALAMQGLTDAEIADGLEARFGQSLHPDVFGSMKNGTYAGWTDEENERRSAHIYRVLARGRRKITGIVRGVYLKAAIGGKKLKNKSTTTRHLRDEDGNLTGKDEIQIVESEYEQGPNMQALAVWLYHHDPQWRAVERGGEPDTDGDSAKVAKGVDIEAWIKRETTVDVTLENGELQVTRGGQPQQ